MTDAILGTTTTSRPSTATSTIEVKPGTQSADIVTVKDRGITRLRGGGRGDLKVGIQVVTPDEAQQRGNAISSSSSRLEAGARCPSSPLPAGTVREAARPVPRLDAATSSSLYLGESLDLDRDVAVGPRSSSPVTRRGTR